MGLLEEANVLNYCRRIVWVYSCECTIVGDIVYSTKGSGASISCDSLDDLPF